MSKKRNNQNNTKNLTGVLPQGTIWKLNNRQLLLLFIATAAATFSYSFIPQGFYQHDEVSHFLNMLEFWNNPNSILGNWAKLGYKLLFVIPALLGIHVVTILNSLISAASCVVAYKVAEQLGNRIPIAAFFLVASQPIWVQMSFRNYSEPLSALILIGCILLCLKNKFEIAAIVISYGAIIRQEFYVIALCLGIYLLIQKRYWAVLLLLLFPLINNLWGWIATGDPLYLYNSTVQTGQKYQSAYPKQGFEHYFIMAPVFWGIVSLMLLIICFCSRPLHVRQLWFVVIPLIVYFGLHCLFNTQSLKIGASTGGNLRYMAVISPLIAVCATFSIDYILTLKKRTKLLYITLPIIIAIGIWTTYPDNNVVYSYDKRDLTRLFIAIAVLLGILAFKSPKLLGGFLIVASIVSLVGTAKTLHFTPEDLTIKQVAQWGKSVQIENYNILLNHSLFYYWYGKASYQFANGAGSIDSNSVQNAQPKTMILWDSHYSYRPELNPKSVPLDFFRNRPEQYKLVNQFISTDQRFGLVVFQKQY